MLLTGRPGTAEQGSLQDAAGLQGEMVRFVRSVTAKQSIPGVKQPLFSLKVSDGRGRADGHVSSLQSPTQPGLRSGAAHASA